MPTRKAERRKPDEFAVHLFLSSGHKEEVRFTTVQEFQKWYSGELLPKFESNNFITVPIQNIQGEYMVVRPSKCNGNSGRTSIFWQRGTLLTSLTSTEG